MAPWNRRFLGYPCCGETADNVWYRVYSRYMIKRGLSQFLFVICSTNWVRCRCLILPNHVGVVVQQSTPFRWRCKRNTSILYPQKAGKRGVRLFWARADGNVHNREIIKTWRSHALCCTVHGIRRAGKWRKLDFANRCEANFCNWIDL